MAEDLGTVSAGCALECGLAQCERSRNIALPFGELRLEQKLFAAERGLLIRPAAHLRGGSPLQESTGLRGLPCPVEEHRQRPAARGDLRNALATLGQLPAVLENEQGVIGLTGLGEKPAECQPGLRSGVMSNRREKVSPGEQGFRAGFRLGRETKRALSEFK